MISILAAICAAGWLSGFLLLRRVPNLPALEAAAQVTPAVAVIIPARNEAANLPALLNSLLVSSPIPAQILVVDDHSTDGTAAVATAYGAEVLASKPLPEGWTGKTWACHQGSTATKAELLFFLDADTRFVQDGFARTVAYFSALPQSTALSILPFHVMERPYEELSLFFNLLMAMGAGGFTGLGRPRLFGPALLIERELYQRCGGHAGVRASILENLRMADRVDAAGGRCRTLVGREVLHTRMFPLGFSQLYESWRKAFVSGAGATRPLVLGISLVWLTAACTTFLLVVFALPAAPILLSALYLAFALQIFAFSRQLGRFGLLTALFYPLPLVFYFFVFFASALAQRGGRGVAWKGRRV